MTVLTQRGTHEVPQTPTKFLPRLAADVHLQTKGIFFILLFYLAPQNFHRGPALTTPAGM